MDTEILRQFVENEKEKARLESELDVVKAEKDRLQTIIVTMFSEEGTQSHKLIMPDGGFRTVHLRRDLYVGHTGDKQALCDALKDGGYESQVKESYNTQSLSSLFRELAAEYHQVPNVSRLTVEEILEAVPEDIRVHAKINEMFKIGVRST